ncbi:uncharacterized protein LOC117123325 [Anneissia japonica]|uniref:uncharacterized protein LOC117123325 n=1 Tax=Anneissia japonica TaxID=1529436 RepID=UPI001425A5DE|nr:uncharacterized protein LOC117123325 [Anneissia japonica]
MAQVMRKPIIMDCGNEISLEDIYNLGGVITEKCHSDFLETAILMVSKAESNVFKNAEISIEVPGQKYILYSGGKYNKFYISSNSGKVGFVQTAQNSGFFSKITGYDWTKSKYLKSDMEQSYFHPIYEGTHTSFST